jgi:dipeptidase
MKFKVSNLSIAALIMIIMLSVAVMFGTTQEQPYDNCTSLSITPGATVDGSAMCTHTDDSGSDSPHLNMVPAQDWEPGSMRELRINTDVGPLVHVNDPIYVSGEIPQVDHTYAYTNSAYTFQNEMGVGVGESTIGCKEKLVNMIGLFEQTELTRVGLERAATAREFIQTVGELGEKYGFRAAFGCCAEMRAVIDKDEAWVLEMYPPGALWNPESGKPGMVWVAQRVPDGEIAVCGNLSIIGAIDLDDKENFMGSEHIYTFAEELGLWDPDSGKEFRVYDVYGSDSYSIGCSRRVWRVQDLLAPSLNLNPNVWHYPFSVKPDELVSAQDIMAINRDHYQGTEFDVAADMEGGPFGNPNTYSADTEGYPSSAVRNIAIAGANWSTVVVARKDMPAWIGSLTWFGYDNPATTCYIPIYSGATELPESFSKGMRGGGYDVFSRESAWWAFNVVSNYAGLIWDHMIEDIKAVRDPLEEEFFALQPAIEKTAIELYEQDPELARNFITNYTNSCANRAVDAYWKLASQLFGRYNDGAKYADNEYKRDRIIYPDWWVKEVEFGKDWVLPEEEMWYTIDQKEAPGK